MGFIMFVARKTQLQNKQNDVSFQLTSITNKLDHYKDLGAILSQDSVKLDDIASISPSLFSFGLGRLQGIDSAAAQRADMEMNMAMQSGMFGPNPDPQLQMITRQKMYENARKEFQRQLARELNEVEKDLQNKKTRLDTELTMIQQELQSLDQHIASGIKSQIGGYGLQG